MQYLGTTMVGSPSFEAGHQALVQHMAQMGAPMAAPIQYTGTFCHLLLAERQQNAGSYQFGLDMAVEELFNILALRRAVRQHSNAAWRGGGAAAFRWTGLGDISSEDQATLRNALLGMQ
jgi:hypothetical protein